MERNESREYSPKEIVDFHFKFILSGDKQSQKKNEKQYDINPIQAHI